MKPDAVVAIVDDDAGVRAALEALLAGRGYGVETFESAEAFLAGPASARADCLLLDLRMPGMGGLELQRELKRRKVALPVVMITGHGDIPTAVAAIKAGAVDFLEKPFDSDVVLAAVQAALRHAAAPRADALPDRDAVARRVAQLTPREREVMNLVTAGVLNKVIAHRLNIALRTVEIHRARVMEKTGARNLSELVRMAIRLDQPD